MKQLYDESNLCPKPISIQGPHQVVISFWMGYFINIDNDKTRSGQC